MLIGRYPALLDANVLHPAFLRGALLYFADEHLFRPYWSADIIGELKSSIGRRFVDVDTERLATQMNEAFPDAEIDGYQPFIDALKLPDPNDQHVLAAAIVGRCAGIVTANVKHFPAEIVQPLNMEIVHPDDFIVNIIDLDAVRAVEACKRHRAWYRKPELTADEYLRQFERCGLIQARERLDPHAGLL